MEYPPPPLHPFGCASAVTSESALILVFKMGKKFTRRGGQLHSSAAAAAAFFVSDRGVTSGNETDWQHKPLSPRVAASGWKRGHTVQGSADSSLQTRLKSTIIRRSRLSMMEIKKNAVDTSVRHEPLSLRGLVKLRRGVEISLLPPRGLLLPSKKRAFMA